MTWAIEEKSYSQRRACALVGLHPRTYRYASTRPDDTALRAKLQDLASQRRRFGYRRLGLNVLMVGRKCERPSLPEHHQLLWEFFGAAISLDPVSRRHAPIPSFCGEIAQTVEAQLLRPWGVLRAIKGRRAPGWPAGGTEVSVLLTRLYVPSGDFAEPAYAARTSHWAARVKREARTPGCIIRIGDCGDNFQTGAEGSSQSPTTAAVARWRRPAIGTA